MLPRVPHILRTLLLLKRRSNLGEYSANKYLG